MSTDQATGPRAAAPNCESTAGCSHEAACEFKHRPDGQLWCQVCTTALDPQRRIPKAGDANPAGAVRTIQQQLESALRDYENMLDNASVGIVLTVERKILRYNPKFSQLFGYSESSALGQPGRVLYRSDDDYAELGRMAGPLLARGKPVQHELYLRRRDGSEFWANAFGFVADPLDPARGTWWFIEDRTLFKQNEEALRRNYAELQATHRALELTQAQLLQSEKMASLGQLAAGVAHEINTPLAFVNSNLGTLGVYANNLLALVGAYERALGGAPVPDQIARDLAAARQAADIDYLREDLDALLKESRKGLAHVRDIVLGLNEFSRADDGVWQTADLNETLRGALHVMGNELKDQAEVTLELAELPPVYCNPAQIGQVLISLLVNAAYAMRHAGRLALRSGGDERWVWLEVQDDGPGIPAGLQARIFDPFFTTKPVGQGTGLGLSIAYGIVNRHGGRFELESQPGLGARFRVWLPVAGPATRAVAAATGSMGGAGA